MCHLNGWHPFESIRFDLVSMPSSSDLGATKTASTKTKSNSTTQTCTQHVYQLKYIGLTQLNWCEVVGLYNDL